jgi:NADH:ubiquinone oxidoreductase subunit H
MALLLQAGQVILIMRFWVARSAAQMISYEVSIGLIVATIIVITGTLVTKHNMPFWVDLLLIPMAIVFSSCRN